ncbi:MAG: nucleotidyltransferase domain-containing protein [Candidatus Methanoperedens sp.]|nr:nucleotidyltransferase domain-containing protein [Candidatus Methanoperedens sp.]
MLKRFAIFASLMERNMNEATDILKEYSKVLSSKLGKFTGILYGSMARGDYNLWSDIDFLVISDELPENPLKKLEFLYSLTEIPIEVKGYTRNEFLKMVEKRNPIALDALVEGKVIVDDGFWEIAKYKFEETKKKYELIKEDKHWISLSMKRNFLKDRGKVSATG